MKTSLSNLNEALAFQLKGLYDAEKKLQKAIPPCSKNIASPLLKETIDKYYESSGDKIIKLERAFNYLMTEPTGRKNEVMEKMIEDTHHVLKYAATEQMRDVVLISCIQNINHYKISGYRTALAFAIELELTTVSDLLHEILEWENQAARSLANLAVNEINQKVS
jgi:ferritin-like metal-binding protein YciE